MRIKFTLPQKAMECVSCVALAFMPVYLAIVWSKIPDAIPTHYGFTGVADAWGSKNTVIVLPIVCAALYAMLTVVSFYPGMWNTPIALTDENRERVLGTLLSMLCAMKMGITLFFSYLTVSVASALPLGAWVTCAFLIFIFAVIIIYVVLAVKRGKAETPPSGGAHEV